MKKVNLFLGVLVIVSITISAFVGANKTSQTTSNEVKIGKQIWMTENLNVDKFRNGDPIPEAKTNEEWKKAGAEGKPAWCYYDNLSIQKDPVNGKKYGKLYNWHAINDPRGLAPSGWHVPGENDWKKLITYLGGEEAAGKKIKSTGGWKENNGTNESGYSGLPGGIRGNNDEFNSLSSDGFWWSASEYDTDNGKYFFLHSDGCMMEWGFKYYGMSVRCLKD